MESFRQEYGIKALKILGLAFMAVVIGVGIFFYFYGQNPRQERQLNGITSNYDYLPSCGDETEFFTAPPVALQDLFFIRPLGFIGSPPEHIYPTDHIYLFTHTTKDDIPIEVPFYAPGDMWITQISEVEMDKPIPNSKDYALYFSACKEVGGFFTHLSTVTDKIQSEIAPPFVFCGDEELGRFKTHSCIKDVQIKISAGEKLGTIGKLSWQYSVDFTLYDSRTPPLDYANPFRWSDWKQHLVCPLDYFDKELKTNLKSLLGDGYSMARTAEPVCGEVEQDEPGTAQGTWFTKDLKDAQEEFSRPELSLIHDYVDPSIGAIAIGIAPPESGLASNVYYFNPVESGFVNRDFKYVKDDGNIYCYDSLYDQWDSYKKIQPLIYLVEMTSPTTLKIGSKDAESCGSGPWSFDKFAGFER